MTNCLSLIPHKFLKITQYPFKVDNSTKHQSRVLYGSRFYLIVGCGLLAIRFDDDSTMTQ